MGLQTRELLTLGLLPTLRLDSSQAHAPLSPKLEVPDSNIPPLSPIPLKARSCIWRLVLKHPSFLLPKPYFRDSEGSQGLLGIQEPLKVMHAHHWFTVLGARALNKITTPP